MGRAEVPFFGGSAGAVGRHPTQTIICAVYPRSHRAPAPIYARAKAIREEAPMELPRRQFLHLAARSLPRFQPCRTSLGHKSIRLEQLLVVLTPLT